MLHTQHASNLDSQQMNANNIQESSARNEDQIDGFISKLDKLLEQRRMRRTPQQANGIGIFAQQH